MTCLALRFTQLPDIFRGRDVRHHSILLNGDVRPEAVIAATLNADYRVGRRVLIALRTLLLPPTSI